MLTLHHLENSRSHRILWLFEELGLEYRIVEYKRHPKTMLAPPELKAIHPLGKSPIVVDDTTAGQPALAESGFIVETLIERHGPHLAPKKDDPDHLRYRYWMHYAEGSAMPPLLLKLVTHKIATAPVPFFIRPIVKKISATVDAQFVDNQLAVHFDHMETTLAAQPHFAGAEFSGADIMMSFPIEGGAGRIGATATRPHLSRWLAAMKARPAYQRALEKGGPLSLGF